MNEKDLKQAKRFILSRERKIKNKNEKRTFFCSIHSIFHKYKFKGKPSKTYQKCLKKLIDEKEPVKFLDDFTMSELFKIDLRKKFTQEKANYYK